MARDTGRRADSLGFMSGSPPKGRDLNRLPGRLASAGTLEVRLATTKKEIRRAQELRYRMFFEEGGAVPDPTARSMRRDVCRFDRVCDHLIVVDNCVAKLDGSPSVVGAYRLLRQEVAEANFGFYSAREFQVGRLIARHPEKRFLELGRSCVASDYRGKRALELLWRGIWAYAKWHRIDAMFGCASFPGAEPDAHARTMRFLRGENEIDANWRVEAVSGRAASCIAAEEPPPAPRDALRAMPPLIKAYWRLGAKFSPEAVVDPAFRTTDVFVVLPVEAIKSRYLAHFAPGHESCPLAA